MYNEGGCGLHGERKPVMMLSPQWDQRAKLLVRGLGMKPPKNLTMLYKTINLFRVEKCMI